MCVCVCLSVCLSVCPPICLSVYQLLAVVYTNFTKQEKDKFQQLFLHKREALHHAFHVLAGPNGIEFDDFLLFMQHYKPHIRECEEGREGGREGGKKTRRDGQPCEKMKECG